MIADYIKEIYKDIVKNTDDVNLWQDRYNNLSYEEQNVILQMIVDEAIKEEDKEYSMLLKENGIELSDNPRSRIRQAAELCLEHIDDCEGLDFFTCLSKLIDFIDEYLEDYQYHTNYIGFNVDGNTLKDKLTLILNDILALNISKKELYINRYKLYLLTEYYSDDVEMVYDVKNIENTEERD